MALPSEVRIVEVGARDGLQNEKEVVPTAVKIELIERLAAAGLPAVEATAFVSPKWVPQMADHAEVMRGLTRRPGTRYPVLTPNLKGLESALEVGADEVAVFGAASEAFSKRNINCTIAESLERFRPVVERAREAGAQVRGYVSCVLGCPYDGPIPVADVVATASRLYQMGCYEISLGDTIGAGVPSAVRDLVAACAMAMPVARLAAHFHDTWGMAVANCVAALEGGIRVFDSSVSGLGGCPYSPGATGNVATEDLIYLFEGMGLDTGADLEGVIHAGDFADRQLGRETASRVARAWRARQAAG